MTTVLSTAIRETIDNGNGNSVLATLCHKLGDMTRNADTGGTKYKIKLHAGQPRGCSCADL